MNDTYNDFWDFQKKKSRLKLIYFSYGLALASIVLLLVLPAINGKSSKDIMEVSKIKAKIAKDRRVYESALDKKNRIIKKLESQLIDIEDLKKMIGDIPAFDFQEVKVDGKFYVSQETLSAATIELKKQWLNKKTLFGQNEKRQEVIVEQKEKFKIAERYYETEIERRKMIEQLLKKKIKTGKIITYASLGVAALVVISNFIGGKK